MESISIQYNILYNLSEVSTVFSEWSKWSAVYLQPPLLQFVLRLHPDLTLSSDKINFIPERMYFMPNYIRD